MKSLEAGVIELENQARDRRITKLEEQNRLLRAQLIELVKCVRSHEMKVDEQMRRFWTLERHLGIR